MGSKKSLGQIGEDLACEYLVKKGYRILKRNYWQPWGEIDIIARARNNTLIFVEVKALQEYGQGNDNDDDDDKGIKPEDHLTASKLQKLQRTCQKFVSGNSEMVDEKRGWQIDLVAITLPANPLDLERNPEHCRINHYQNIADF